MWLLAVVTVPLVFSAGFAVGVWWWVTHRVDLRPPGTRQPAPGFAGRGMTAPQDGSGSVPSPVRST